MMCKYRIALNHNLLTSVNGWLNKTAYFLKPLILQQTKQISYYKPIFAVMNILINIKILSKFDLFDKAEFFNSFFLRIIRDHPEHDFFLIGDDVLTNISAYNNLTILSSAPNSVLINKFWVRYKLPSLLKKNKIEVIIHLDSSCFSKTVIPQLVLVPDLSLFPPTYLSKKNTLVWLDKATTIVTFSQTNKNSICKSLKIAEDKIAVIYTGPSNKFIALDIQETESIKEKYTEGKEYFLFSGEINANSNLINLLKAFSFFKKRQKSNMQLIIITKNVLPTNSFVESLKTYKYRNEVKLLVGLSQNEVAKIMAGAYSFVFAIHQSNEYVQLLQAMQCNVPAIVSNSLLMNEIAGDAALYTDPAIFENIADKMMLLFKDEDKRNELIRNGKNQSEQYSAALTSELLWQNIVKCAASSK